MGSQNSTTHIANAYSEEIAARVTINKQLVTYEKSGASVGVGAGGASIGVGGSSEAKYAHIFYEPGFVKILPGNFLNFDISGNDGRVYVSIVTRNKIVADNFPVRNDYSVIVDDQGSLRPTKYGTIWVDKQGNHHNNSDEDDDDHDDYDGHE